MLNLMLGDCLERMKELPDCSVDACVTDPPYGLSFMGKGWDHSVPSVEVWREVWRVLKPGAHLLAFFGTRTYHRGVVAIEDAGFEIRDQIGWAFGSGFPKSHDVSKAIDAAAGAVREVVGSGKGRTGKASQPHAGSNFSDDSYQWPGNFHITAPATPDAQRWAGWGTALKPAWEPIVVARKPLDGTVAANVLAWGTGGINVDGCRVGTGDGSIKTMTMPDIRGGRMHAAAERKSIVREITNLGRWPANLIHDGSDEVVGLFPGEGDSGAARFFYCAKASRADREDGLDGAAHRVLHRVNSGGLENDPRWAPVKRANHHPTVKPTDLMRYLCRLVTPPGGVVLDPFMGSGSTGRGAVLEGLGFIGCEMDPEYLAIARARIAAVVPDEPKPVAPVGQLSLFG